uniref:J domain-containing protein n=1 Tax=Tetradesmus obliquus TaxID=3088 RepID=A0A383WL01_TETOB|eukprot:jgi/Sobl393_1/17871/SZX77426.1
MLLPAAVMLGPVPSTAHVKVDIPHGITQREQLLELAKAAVQLWEAQRVLRCARIGQQHPSLEVPAALAIFRQKAHAAGAAVTAAAEEAEKRALKKACRQLQLALHPDKTPQQLAGQQAVFVEAFKALQSAQQLVPALSS